jgi:hypothetical protein
MSLAYGCTPVSLVKSTGVPNHNNFVALNRLVYIARIIILNRATISNDDNKITDHINKPTFLPSVTLRPHFQSRPWSTDESVSHTWCLFTYLHANNKRFGCMWHEGTVTVSISHRTYLPGRIRVLYIPVGILLHAVPT